MKKRLVQMLTLSICILLLSTSIPAKKLTKKAFKGLEGDDRVFYFTSLEFAYNKDNYRHFLQTELGEIFANLNTKFVESIPLEKLKSSIEEKYGIKLNTKAFEMKLQEKQEDKFFSKEPVRQDPLMIYKWSVPSRKNRLSILVYAHKLGNMRKIDKLQIEIKFLKINSEKTAYKQIGSYLSKKTSWNTPTQIYKIIKNHCFIK